ncbi:MFS transporter [Hyphococcus luteus]|uniref:MFS transporter n=1 Tax=Hyphococcus luteus TaxID=2058213 RepID=A0A2S7K5Z3_9PROT|nr:MFS transporter [Marinicaulis flavus]PQA87896.1 MFS transporter [Marinicaulis flavus]
MAQTIRVLSALLIAAFLLISGAGLQGTLLSVRGNIEGFSLVLLGSLMSAYFTGFTIGCQFAPHMVKRVGHIRSFTALASIASAAALAHALAVNPVFWILLRVIAGFCLAGLYMIIESWINEGATNERRGRVLAVYRVVDLSAGTVGQALLATADPADFYLFALVSILISVALVPVALTTTTQPTPITSADIDLKKLFRISPLAAFGCLSVGAANGAYWAVGAVYVQKLGYDIQTVAAFMTTVVVSGALSQWPLGHISDLFDRRILIVAIAALSSAAGVLLALTGGQSEFMLLAGGAAFGFTAMPIFGLAVAHANDRADPHEYVTLAAGLLLLYGAGAIVGPFVAPIIMQNAGPQALFFYTSSVYAALTLFGLYRMRRSDATPPEEREAYVSVPRTSPAVFEIDPRGEHEEDESADEAAEDDAKGETA